MPNLKKKMFVCNFMLFIMFLIMSETNCSVKVEYAPPHIEFVLVECKMYDLMTNNFSYTWNACNLV